MKYLRHLYLLTVSGLLVPTAALAQPRNDTAGIDKAAGLLSKISNILGAIYQLILYVGGAVVVLMIVIGGLQYIANQKEGAKKTIIAAITGAVIIILSSALLTLLKSKLPDTTIMNLTNTP